MTFRARAVTILQKTWPLLAFAFVMGAMSADQLGFHTSAWRLAFATTAICLYFAVFYGFGFE